MLGGGGCARNKERNAKGCYEIHCLGISITRGPRGKRDVRRNLIGLKTTFIIAEPIKFRVSFANRV